VCPEGSLLATIQPGPGYWYAAAQDGSAGKMLSCVNSACCSEPGTAGCEGNRTCAVGFMGPLCAQCMPGYGQAAGGECAECPDQGSIIVQAALFIVGG